MTDEMLSKLLNDEIAKMFKNNSETICEELLRDIEHPGNVDADTTRMLVKSIRLSILMSTQLIFRILDETGVLPLPPDGTPLIHLVDED